ncbi:MAG: hypothetical protein Q8P32_01325 [Candidatus Komeilibacteria bacterium]|nr:hypothetical protein [Candidatus Komeilibacteria bacterium]
MKDIKPSAGRDIMPVNPSEVKGIVMPLHGPIDKHIACWIVLRAVGHKVPVVSYSTTDPNDSELIRYRSLGYYLLDVGENKYQARKTGSATETICRDFRVTDPMLLSLVAVANHNNQTGYLKGYSPVNEPNVGDEWSFDIRFGEAPDEVENVRVKSSDVQRVNWSISWLLREAYKVGIDMNQIIKHVHSVLDSWYQVVTGNIDESRWDRRVVQNGRIRDLWRTFGNPRLKNGRGELVLPPFSLPWLVWGLGVLGEDELEASSRRIEHEIQWWISVQKAVVQMRTVAKHWALGKTSPDVIKLMRAGGQVFELNQAPDITVGYFVADEVQTRELWPQVADGDTIDRLLGSIFNPKRLNCARFGCLIIRNPITNRVAILAGREALDFREVSDRLSGIERQKREEDKDHATKVWHLDIKGQPGKQRHWLLNGSDNWPLPETQVDIPTILQIVRKATKRFR